MLASLLAKKKVRQHMNESLEKFGAFIVRNLRDKMLHDVDMVLHGAWKAPGIQELQKRVASLSDADKMVLRDLAEHITTTGMHDLLFALQEEADADGAIRLFVDGKEVARFSDGLHGEIFGDEGWIVRYSSYSSEAQIALSRWAKEQIQEMLGGDNEHKR
jgi:hypothetical protein